ncbi:MAG: hypothetical protein J7497_15520, partial [Chitinophagaceae bacterium]|nr:hypothetical protein [Chitinophagaceae bacterium]
IIIYGYIALIYNYRHPLLPVKESIFGPKTFHDYIYDKELLDMKYHLDNKPYKKIGIYIGLDSWDYPYYRLLARKGKNERVLHHVFVNNESTIYEDNFTPDAIISLESSVKEYTLNGKKYYQTGVYKDAVLFESK